MNPKAEAKELIVRFFVYKEIDLFRGLEDPLGLLDDGYS
jgi:hypothetical protein